MTPEARRDVEHHRKKNSNNRRHLFVQISLVEAIESCRETSLQSHQISPCVCPCVRACVFVLHIKTVLAIVACPSTTSSTHPVPPCPCWFYLHPKEIPVPGLIQALRGSPKLQNYDTEIDENNASYYKETIRVIVVDKIVGGGTGRYATYVRTTKIRRKSDRKK